MRKSVIILILLVLALPPLALAMTADDARAFIVTNCQRGCMAEADRKGAPQIKSLCKPICSCWIDDMLERFSLKEIVAGLSAKGTGKPDEAFESNSGEILGECAKRGVQGELSNYDDASGGDRDDEDQPADPAPKPAAPVKKPPPGIAPVKVAPKPGGSPFRAN